ncbi:MAG: PadR family transcriptional regulator [Bryobacteraceae bacterium]
MPKGDALGGFEQLILLALARLGDDAYGVSIRKEIAARTGRDVNIGAVYATLDRLESKGLTTSNVGEPTAERGGRAKRYFHLSAAGASALEESCRALEGMMKGLNWGALG